MTPVDGVLMIRHGEAAGSDAPSSALSKRGRRQADSLAARLSRYDVSHVIVSPYGRAKATGEAVAAACGLEAEVDDDLREIDLPLRRPLDIPAILRQLRTGSFDDWDGVDIEAFKDRVGRVVQRLLQVDGLVVAVSHGGVINAAVSWTLQGRFRLAVDTLHTSITHFVRSPDGLVEMRAINDTRHLGDPLEGYEDTRIDSVRRVMDR